MPMRSLLASALAAALAGAALPAAAISIDFSSIGEQIAVTSDVAAYNDWASTCPNVTLGGTCGSGGGSVNSGNTLFFWGQRSDPNNTKITLTYQGTETIQNVRGIRFVNTGTDPLGPASGPLPYDNSQFPGQVNFNSATRTQGEGIFLAYGREVYDSVRSSSPDYLITSQAVQSSVNGFMSFQVAVDVGQATVPAANLVTATTTLAPSTISGNDKSAVPRYVGNTTDINTGLNFTPFAANPFSLAQGDTIELELFVTGITTATPVNLPRGLMDDIQITFLTDPQLSVDPTPGPVLLGNVRAGTKRDDAGSITARNVGTGTAANPQLNVTFQAVAGTNPNQIQAEDPNPTLGFDLDYEASGARTYRLNATGESLTIDDKAGKALSATQAIAVGAGDAGGPQTRELRATVVGPILGVKEHGTDNPLANSLEYGTEISFNVDLSFDRSQTKVFDISNLFNVSDIDTNLTRLTLGEVWIDGDSRFSIIEAEDFSGKTVDAGSTFGTGLQVVFAPEALDDGGSSFTAQLRFKTDMNNPLGDTLDEKFFNLLGSVTKPKLEVSDTLIDPVTEPLRAGSPLGSITATNVGNSGTTLSKVLFADPTGDNADRLAWTDNRDDMATPPDGATLHLPEGGTSEEATRSYTVALGIDDRSAVKVNAVQAVTAEVAGIEQQEVVDIEFDIAGGGAFVGPVLGVNDGPLTLAYGEVIDLGALDIGEEVVKILTISNLFGQAFDNDTMLTIGNVALEDDSGQFSLLSVLGDGCVDGNPYDKPEGQKVELQALEVGPGICIAFKPNSPAGTYNATLRFFTDMNRPFGNIAPFTSGGLSLASGGLFGIASTQPGELLFVFQGSVLSGVPAPGVLALVGLGLAGLAGVRARQRRAVGRVGGGA